MRRNIEDMDKCEYGACRKKAVDMAYSRESNSVVFCCREHGDIVIDENNPEYWDDCPNCKCRIGVN